MNYETKRLDQTLVQRQRTSSGALMETLRNSAIPAIFLSTPLSTFSGCQNQDTSSIETNSLTDTLTTSENSTTSTQATTSTSSISISLEPTSNGQTTESESDVCTDFYQSCSEYIVDPKEIWVEGCKQAIEDFINCREKLIALYACRAEEKACQPLISSECDDEGFDFINCTDPTYVCGNKEIDINEECDDGNVNHSDDCANCKNAVPGDCYVHEGVEQCEDGNIDNGDGCNSEGQWEDGICGDGIRNISSGILEECDDGAENSEMDAKCKPDCTISEDCGNGQVDPGEECDPNSLNEEESFICTPSCRIWIYDKCPYAYPYNFIQ